MNRQRLPEPLAQVIRKRERVMAWASGPPMLEDSPVLVAATDRAFYAPGLADRVAWEQVTRATWGEPILEVVYLQDVGDAGETGEVAPEPPSLTDPVGPAEISIVDKDDLVVLRITLDEPGSVPQSVWERVESTIIMARHVKLQEDKGVRMVARRMRDSEAVNWQLIFDPELNSRNLDLQDAALSALAQLRDSLGI